MKEINVKSLQTPNPNALKFIVNSTLKSSGKSTFTSLKEAEDLPLVKDIFFIDGIRQVYIQGSSLTVTQDGTKNNVEIEDQVTAILKTRILIHDPNFKVAGEKEERKIKDRTHLSKELLEIEEILDRTIRPGLQSDGGDIEVINFENDELRIMYQGACGGCPSAMMGTLQAIQNILSHELQNPDILVIPI